MDLIPPERWQKVPCVTNPDNSASRGLYPQELADHDIWWNGPSWLLQPLSHWPETPALEDKPEPSEEKASSEGLGLVSLAVIMNLPLHERMSDYSRLRRVTSWVRRFVNNCCSRVKWEELEKGNLSGRELIAAEKV